MKHEQAAPLAEDPFERTAHHRGDIGLLDLVPKRLKCEAVVYGPIRKAILQTVPADDLDGAG
jgi:hypothetical protein